MSAHVTSASQVDAETQRQKTALLFRNAGVAQAVTVVNASMFAYVNASLQAAPRAALAWWCAAIGIAVTRFLLARRFLIVCPDAAAAVVWRRRYVAVTALSAATWGVGSVLFIWNAPLGARLFSGLVLAGMIAGAVPLLAAVPAAFFTFALLVGVPMSVAVLLQADSALLWAFGAMSLIFLAAMLASARFLHATLDAAIRLRLEEGRLVASQRLLSAAVEQSSSSIIVTDTDGNMTFVNAAFCRTTGYAPDEVLGHNPRLLKSGETPPDVYRELWAALSGGRAWRGELQNRAKSGELYWEAASISPVVDAAGRTTHYLAVKDDITQRKLMEQELARLATTDPLTGVANRRRFLDQLGLELDRVKRLGDPAALLMVDVDHFKRVNDTHGHATGDAVLQHLSDLARLQLRRIDLFGRLGGEEFGVLLPGTTGAGASQLADRFRRHVAETPAQTALGPIPITISIGLAELRPTDSTPDEILDRADAALFRAKEGGRNRVEVA